MKAIIEKFQVKSKVIVDPINNYFNYVYGTTTKIFGIPILFSAEEGDTIIEEITTSKKAGFDLTEKD